MATVNLSPYTAESEAIARRLRMAEALGQKAAQPLDMPTMPGVRISPYAGLAKMLESYTAGRDERAAREESKALGEKYQKDISADYGTLLKGMTPTAAVPEGPSTFTANVDQRDVAENPRMVMKPERNEFNEVIQPGEPGAGSYGVTPGTPAIPASAGKLTAEGFSAMQTPEGRQLFMAQLLAQNKPKDPIKLGKGDILLDADTKKPIFTAEKDSPIREVRTTDANGMPITKYIPENVLVGMGGIPDQFKGFAADLIMAKNMPAQIMNDPQLINLVGSQLNKQAGLVTQEDVANYMLKVAETRAKLGYEGIPFPEPKPMVAAGNPLVKPTLPKGVPSSAVQTGKFTPDGRPVYQTPDGKKHVEDK
jgi:hypothetical protein